MSIRKFGELIEVETVIENSKPSSKSIREKLISVVSKEINYLKQRNTLDTEVTESGNKRINFWRRSSKDNSKGLVCVRYKNKIFDFGERVNRYKPEYFVTDYNVDSVLSLLDKIKFQLEKMDETDKLFSFGDSIVKPTIDKEIDELTETL